MSQKKWAIGGILVFISSLSFVVLMIRCSSIDQTHLYQGDKYFQEGELDTAIMEYSQAIRINPKFFQAHFALAEAYIKKDMLDEAIDELLKVTELQPDNQVAGNRLEEIYRKTQERKIRTLRFGIQPILGPSATVKLMQPLVNYLSEKLNLKVIQVIPPDYASTIEYLRTGQIDIAALGPLEYIKAQEEAEIIPIVIPTIAGRAVQQSVIITRKDSGIKGLDNLKGRTFAFVDRDSAIGYLIPQALLLEHGIDPDKDLKGTIFLGRHDRVFLNVINGQVDAGAMAKSLYNYLFRPGDQIMVLAESEEIPQGPLVVSNKVDLELVKRIKELLVNLYVSQDGYRILRHCQIFDGYLEVVSTEDDTKGAKTNTFMLSNFE